MQRGVTQRRTTKPTLGMGQRALVPQVNPKFAPGNNPLELERMLKTLVPTDREKQRAMIDMLDKIYEHADDNGKKALALWKFQIAQENVDATVKLQFIRGFYFWLLGRGDQVDHDKTLWGRGNAAVYNREVATYIDAFIQKRKNFALQLMILRNNVPQTLNGYYLYYKYIVKGNVKVVEMSDGSSFFDMSDENFLVDFDLFAQEFPGNNRKDDGDDGKPKRGGDRVGYSDLAAGFAGQKMQGGDPPPVNRENFTNRGNLRQGQLQLNTMEQNTIQGLDNSLGISADGQRVLQQQKEQGFAQASNITPQPVRGDTNDPFANAPLSGVGAITEQLDAVQKELDKLSKAMHDRKKDYSKGKDKDEDDDDDDDKPEKGGERILSEEAKARVDFLKHQKQFLEDQRRMVEETRQLHEEHMEELVAVARAAPDEVISRLAPVLSGIEQRLQQLEKNGGSVAEVIADINDVKEAVRDSGNTTDQLILQQELARMQREAAAFQMLENTTQQLAEQRASISQVEKTVTQLQKQLDAIPGDMKKAMQQFVQQIPVFDATKMGEFVRAVNQSIANREATQNKRLQEMHKEQSEALKKLAATIAGAQVAGHEAEKLEKAKQLAEQHAARYKQSETERKAVQQQLSDLRKASDMANRLYNETLKDLNDKKTQIDKMQQQLKKEAQHRHEMEQQKMLAQQYINKLNEQSQQAAQRFQTQLKWEAQQRKLLQDLSDNLAKTVAQEQRLKEEAMAEKLARGLQAGQTISELQDKLRAAQEFIENLRAPREDTKDKGDLDVVTHFEDNDATAIPGEEDIDNANASTEPASTGESEDKKPPKVRGRESEAEDKMKNSSTDTEKPTPSKKGKDADAAYKQQLEHAIQLAENTLHNMTDLPKQLYQIMKGDVPHRTIEDLEHILDILGEYPQFRHLLEYKR